MGKLATVNAGADMCLFHSVGEFYLRQPPLPLFAKWHEMRMGVRFQIVPWNNDDAAVVAESHLGFGFRDWFCFGVKDPSPVPPGVAGSQFVGRRWTGTLSLTASGAAAGQIDGTKTFASVNGTGDLSTGVDAVVPYAQFNAASYASMMGLRLVVVNDGAAGQTVTPYYGNAVGPSADVSLDTLRGLLETVAWTAGATLTWNAGGVALPLPTNWYLRFPFVAHRLRGSCMDMFRVR